MSKGASLVNALRARVPAAAWDRAGTWVSGTARVGDPGREESWIVRVPGRVVPFEVTLWPEEPDWACSCELEACGHAVAVALVRESGLVPAGAVERVAYALRRTREGLVIDRSAPDDAVARPEDLVLNRTLAGWWGRSAVPRGLLREALGQLRGLPLLLDGEPIEADGSLVLPRALVVDDGQGWKVRLVRASGIDEAFRNGVVRMGRTLRPFAEPDLDAVLRQRLVAGIAFSDSDAERLVTEFLPDLARILPVDVRSPRLPVVVEVPPILTLDVRTDGGTLTVTPRIAYGDPPFARVERGRLLRLDGRIPRRDIPAETRIAASLSDAGLAPDLPTSHTGAMAAVWAARLPGGVRAAVLQQAPGFRILGPAADPTLTVEADGTGFRVHVQAGGATPEALLDAWGGGAPLVSLLGGGWRPLPRAWLERHADTLAEIVASSHGGVIPRHAAPALLEAADALDFAVPPALAALRALAGDFDAIPTVPVPATFVGELRTYQQRGVDWIHWLGDVGMGGVLADDMGLGKTVQCLAAFLVRGGPSLVVAPTSVLRNWQAEAARFAPTLSVNVFHGPGRELDRADLTLTTWGTLRVDADRLASVRWNTVVVDEAQAMKNPDSQVAVAARRLDAALRIAATGTPVENRLTELWSILNFTNHGLLGSRKSFADRFEAPIEAGQRRARDELRRRVRPFVLRRLKADVAAELPPRTDLVLRCVLSEEERSLYEAARALSRAEVARMLGAGRTLQVLEVLLRMRQAACHPALLPGAPSGPSAKTELLLDTLEEIVSEGHRALVFSQWTSFLDLLEPALRARGLGFCRLDGSTRDRAGVLATFADPGGPPVFLLSLKAGGVGLNLTAADYVFLLDPWWNPAVEQQATDRAHRIGQTRPVVAYRLIAEDTVEERILALQERKRELAGAALDDAVLGVGLSRQDLEQLFE